MKRPFQIFIFFVVIVAFGYGLSRFFTENPELIQLEFSGYRTKSLSKGLFVTLVFFGGAFLSFLFTFTAVVAKSVECGRLRRENKSLQKLLEEKARDHSSSSKT